MRISSERKTHEQAKQLLSKNDKNMMENFMNVKYQNVISEIYFLLCSSLPTLFISVGESFHGAEVQFSRESPKKL